MDWRHRDKELKKTRGVAKVKFTEKVTQRQAMVQEGRGGKWVKLDGRKQMVKKLEKNVVNVEKNKRENERNGILFQ